MVKKVILMVIGFILLTSCEKKVEEKGGIYNYINKKLPSEFLETFEGGKINLNELKGKPTVLNLWFIGCSPCVDEMPVLNEIKEKFSNQVNFISYSL